MRPFLALMLIGSVLLAGCAPKVVTRSEMHRLRPGMTYPEAVKVIDAPGRLSRPDESVIGALVPSPGQDVYVWTNADGSLVSAAFDGGRLAAFSEHGF
jgi:hypothetical protein